MCPFVSGISWDLISKRLERNLKFQKMSYCILISSKFNDSCAWTFVRSHNKDMETKILPPYFMADTLHCVTNNVYVGLFDEGNWSTDVYYMYLSILKRSSREKNQVFSSLFRNILLHCLIVGIENFGTTCRSHLQGWGIQPRRRFQEVSRNIGN